MKKPDLDKLQRLLDYNLNLDDPGQRGQTEELLARDEQARVLNDALRRTLKPLESWPDEPVPPGLAQRTMQLITQHDQASIVAEASARIVGYRNTSKPEGLWHGRGRWIMSNLRDLVTVAACLLLAVMVSQPGVRHARELSRQYSCASQMRQVGAGLSQYAMNNEGLLPSVEYEPGTVWWSIGKKGEVSSSNTRNVFLLVQQGYLPAEVFVCPGSDRKPKVRIDLEKLKAMTDFASREHVSYSFRLMFEPRHLEMDSDPGAVIMTDVNPLFADLDSDNNTVLDLTAVPFLWKSNSPNHNDKGQNVLFNDGSVNFKIIRQLGPGMDDIFTIKGVQRYHGVERPQEDDIFIAP